MSNYNIEITIPKGTKFYDNDITIQDITGKELEKYYDGWEYSNGGMSYFFYDLDENLVNLAKERMNKYDDKLQIEVWNSD
jgi:hypothetical protein